MSLSSRRSLGEALVLEHLGVDANDEHLFVIGPVEDADAAALGKAQVGAPEKVVLELGGAGLLEAGNVAALRVDAAHHVADGAVFAGGVHALEDEQKRIAIGAVEQLLLIAERGDVLLEMARYFFLDL